MTSTVLQLITCPQPVSLRPWLCPSRLAVVAVLHSLPERPRGGDQGLRRGPADEGAAEERAAGPGRQGRRREQSQPQQWTLRQGKRLYVSRTWCLTAL